jgi:phosphoketolase
MAKQLPSKDTSSPLTKEQIGVINWHVVGKAQHLIKSGKLPNSKEEINKYAAEEMDRITSLPKSEIERIINETKSRILSSNNTQSTVTIIEPEYRPSLPGKIKQLNVNRDRT